jgi:hypothetical protein
VISGRIIRIFDNQRVVMNLGAEHGVEEGMEFGIFTPEDLIIDPQTGEELGAYRRRKAIVVAREVFPTFAVASPPPRRERIEDPGETIQGRIGIGALLGSRARYRTVPGHLQVEAGDLQPLPTGVAVSLGDIVEAPDPEPDAELGEDATQHDGASDSVDRADS